jgi:hypothetical protein
MSPDSHVVSVISHDAPHHRTIFRLTLIIICVRYVQCSIQPPYGFGVTVSTHILIRLAAKPIPRPRQETLRHLGRQQTVVVLREHGMVPRRIVHAQADKPVDSRL